LGSQ
jgi:hypothetical protein